MNFVHRPVMLKEMLEILSPRDGEVYLDATFGAGGYSEAILQAADCFVYAVDRDASVMQYFEPLHRRFPHRISITIDCFSNIKQILQSKKINGIVLDIGTSTMQLRDSKRGFSFMLNGPLDMRMDNKNCLSAATFVNTLRKEKIARVIYEYGEERHAKRIAHAIVHTRRKKPFTTTFELAELVRRIVKYDKRNKIDPATRTFQAIRIWVNNELEELQKGISVAIQSLALNGRLLITSFHSLEDSIVKKSFNSLCGKSFSHRYLTENTDVCFTHITKNALMPSQQEISSNISARSARLRAIRKIKEG